jgi:hypothetical protein
MRKIILAATAALILAAGAAPSLAYSGNGSDPCWQGNSAPSYCK